MLFGAVVSAQGRGAATSARDRAPIDLTGYWVSYVTENWRYRMVTPAKGEYRRIPASRRNATVLALGGRHHPVAPVLGDVRHPVAREIDRRSVTRGRRGTAALR